MRDEQEASDMPGTNWTIHGKEFINCNCSYGCPCQFNGLPTYGNCEAVGGFQIDEGSHGDIRLDGLRFVGIFKWPGPIHEGKGEAALVVDERATPEQREALVRIASGQDTDPGATVFSVFATTLDKVHPPIFAPIDFEVDVDKRRARLVVPGVTEGRGEPIVNPVTGKEHRARIDLTEGFEYTIAEIGRGWSNATSPVQITLSDSYGQFANLHMNQHGVIR
jgi:hypothetical protein